LVAAGQTFGFGKPPDPLTETPSAAVQVGATAVRNLDPATPWHGPTAPRLHWVVEPICTGPPALKVSSGTVFGSVDWLAGAAPALVARPRF
jgi:hypothetical protein